MDMQVKIGTFGRLAAALVVLVLAACETREPPTARYVPPEPPARGPNSPFPVPEPIDKPEPEFPIVAAPLGKKTIATATLDDVPGGGTVAPPPKRPSYAGKASAPPRPQGTPAPAAAGERTITVEPGDTVYALARRHGVNAREIIELNGLEPPYGLKVGQKLRIPGGERHSVVPGDTLYSISRRYGVDIDSLTRANGVGENNGIVIGQLLVIPAASGGALEPATSVAAVVPATQEAAPGKTDKMPGGFIWPARGELIATFGPQRGGARSDGIKIRLPRGASIQATAAGTVVYTGNELKGFGNLILLRHTAGWVSAYAHNDDVLVSRGQAVGKGAVIARAGSSGAAQEPQLHFELRQGARAVDPMQFLPPA